jgi:hypothetical protein
VLQAPPACAAGAVDTLAFWPHCAISPPLPFPCPPAFPTTPPPRPQVLGYVKEEMLLAAVLLEELGLETVVRLDSRVRPGQCVELQVSQTNVQEGFFRLVAVGVYGDDSGGGGEEEEAEEEGRAGGEEEEEEGQQEV